MPKLNKGSNQTSIIILAAGKGTRMKSDLPKVMHKVAGREMLNMVIDEAKKLNPQNITIVVSQEMKPFEKEILDNHKNHKISFVLQKERKGTAHAVQTALNNLKNLGKKTLILYGDTPLVEGNTLQKMLEKLNDFSISVLSFEDEKQNSYGRLVLDSSGHLKKIVEFKDANEEEKKILLCNSGVMAVDGEQIKNLLSKVTNDNEAKEFYLTDIIEIAEKLGLKKSFIKTQIEEVLGVNSKIELAEIERIKQNKIRKKMMESGVTMLDPSSVYFSFDTEIANDSIIHQNVVFGKNVSIEKNVEIKSFCHIEGAEISSGSVIGPFARIRPETKIEKDVKVGNFVEIKKSILRSKSKVNHLSYIGDSDVGEEVNIGAGTITCNYNGYEKSKTKIGKKVFIGSNSSLIAPITIGDGAIIAAGSTLTENVLQNDLAIARSQQKNIKNGGKNFHQKKSNKKISSKKNR